VYGATKEEGVMFDQFTPKGRILAAALDCAAKKSWAEVTLADIAETARLPLADLRNELGSKTEILAALVRAVDDEVLKRAPKRAEGQAARDLLFDIVMSRFDVLGPYKSALKSIHASGPADLALAGPLLSSMHWMLEAAGIGTDGATGGLRVTGLATLYASVFGTWLQDDDPGRPHMAALDRRLRRAERTLRNVEDVRRDPSPRHRRARLMRSILRGERGRTAARAGRRAACGAGRNEANTMADVGRRRVSSSTISSRSTFVSAPSLRPSP
jgi:AcrR family transcriptional regulator